MFNEYALVRNPSVLVMRPEDDAVNRNTQIVDTCIVFPQWHISSNASFILSFFVIVALGVLYEWLRVVQKQFDIVIAQKLAAEQPSLSGRSSPHREDDTLMGRGTKPARRCVDNVCGNVSIIIPMQIQDPPNCRSSSPPCGYVWY